MEGEKDRNFIVQFEWNVYFDDNCGTVGEVIITVQDGLIWRKRDDEDDEDEDDD